MYNKAIRAVVFLAVIAAVNAAKAETVWLSNSPKAKLTRAQTLDAAKSGKSVFKCRLTAMGDNLKPKAVKGTKDTFHGDVGSGDDGATKAMLAGAKVYKCQTVAFNAESGSFKRSE